MIAESRNYWVGAEFNVGKAGDFAMTIEGRTDRELQLAAQVAELKREVAELREALASALQAPAGGKKAHRGRISSLTDERPTGPTIRR